MLDHFDDLLFGHFYFVVGLERVAVGELSAVATSSPDYELLSNGKMRTLARASSTTIKAP